MVGGQRISRLFELRRFSSVIYFLAKSIVLYNTGVCRKHSMEANIDPTRTARYPVGSQLPLIDFGLATRWGWNPTLMKLSSALLH